MTASLPAPPVLEVRRLEVDFVQYERGLHRRSVTALAGMDLTASAGEVVAMVGASGAGKSLLAHAVLGLLPPNAVERGAVRYDGVDVGPAARRRLAGRETALVPQSVSYLNPLSSVGRQVRRAARTAGHADPGVAAAEALSRRGLGREVLRQYPHELSGGMARRVLVAIATLGRPRLVIADEPTTGLPTAAVTTTLRDLRALADDGCAVVLITHALDAALQVADRVVICRDGVTVCEADPRAFSGDGSALTDPYTRTLWRALPRNGFHLPETGTT